MAAFPTAGKYQFAFSPNVAGTLADTTATDPESRFNERFLSIIERQMDPEARKQLLSEKLAFDREQMKEAGKYKMLFDLPGQITRAFSAPGALAMEGANRIAATTLEGVARLPQPQVIGRPYAYTPVNYF
jgi:hypothetical protein